MGKKILFWGFRSVPTPITETIKGANVIGSWVMSRQISLQLAWKTFILVDDSNGLVPLITLIERGGGFSRRVILRGYEVEWVAKKLREASRKTDGAILLGRLSNKVRCLEVRKAQNKGGWFVEIKITEIKKKSVIRIPEDGQGKRWVGLEKVLSQMARKGRVNGRQKNLGKVNNESSGQAEIPWSKFREVMDNLQHSLVQCFSSSICDSPISIKVDFGLCSVVIPVSTTSIERKDNIAVGQLHRYTQGGKVARFSTGHAKEMVARNLQMGRAREHVSINFREERAGNVLNIKSVSNDFGGCDGVGEQLRSFSQDHNENSNYILNQAHRRVCNTAANHSKFHIKNSGGTFVGRMDSIRSLLPTHERYKLGSTVVSHKNFVWVQKHKLIEGHDFKGQNDDLNQETLEECNSKLSTQEEVIETDKEEGERSQIRGVERDKDSEKVSHEMRLKRLRAKRMLKGRFWFSNRLDLFRAQRRCGSIRMTNLIFGV